MQEKTIQAGSRAAVLTGDLVESTERQSVPPARLREILSAATRRATAAWGDIIPLPIDVFRGDSWQLLVSDVGRAAHVGAYLRGSLLSSGVDTRLAVGVGRIDVPPIDRVSDGDGEAFRRSGRRLDKLAGAKRRMDIVIADQPSRQQECLSTVSLLMDTIIRRWSAKQARYACGSLLGKTQAQIAREEGVSQQAVSASLDLAGWRAVDHALEHVAKVLTDEGGR